MSGKTAGLVASLTITLSGALQAQNQITPPAVPVEIEVPAGFKPFFAGHAIGTQNFICAPSPTASGLDWVFIGPQATIFNREAEQTLTHFHSKNPFEDGAAQAAIQATWQHSRDTSAVWAVKWKGSVDLTYVAPGAIEWLLLDVTGEQLGPAGGDKLTKAAYIHRVNTIGGVKPPSSECTPATLNHRRLVYYEADYFFYQ